MTTAEPDAYPSDEEAMRITGIVLKTIRNSDAIQRISDAPKNRVLHDLINEYSKKEGQRITEIIELLEIGGCEAPEIGYAIAAIYTGKLEALCNSLITHGLPEVAFMISHTAYKSIVKSGGDATAEIQEKHQETQGEAP